MAEAPFSVPAFMSDQFESLFGAAGVRFAAYLEDCGVDVATTVDEAVQALRSAGRFLDRSRLKAYRQKVLFGVFLTEWVRKNTRVKTVSKEDRCLFDLAILQLVTKSMFRRRISEFVAKHVDTGKMQIRDDEAFLDHTLQGTEGVMDAMRHSFNPKRDGASRGAVAYLENTAISRFLKYRLKARKTFIDRGILSYIEDQSNNLSERMRLAYKLAYLPMGLTPGEVAVLRESYGLTGSLLMPWRIQDVAELLGFTGGAGLSRRLYNVRKWAKSPIRRKAPSGETPPPASTTRNDTIDAGDLFGG